MAIPKDPVVFNKALTCIQGPNDDVRQPEGSEKMDWEVELGVIIGTKAQRVSKANALAHVAGYCLANDVSEREWQANRSGQWVKGKSFDTFGPLGPWLVTADEVPDPQAISLGLAVNGDVRQKSSTADMIFTVAEIISHLSEFMTLLPGDVIVTGTPEGVGLGMKPPQFLKRGDVVELHGGILGEQRRRWSDRGAKARSGGKPPNKTGGYAQGREAMNIGSPLGTPVNRRRALQLAGATALATLGPTISARAAARPIKVGYVTPDHRPARADGRGRRLYPQGHSGDAERRRDQSRGHIPRRNSSQGQPVQSEPRRRGGRRTHPAATTST